MKKILSSVLVMSLLAVVLSGCSKPAEATNTADGEYQKVTIKLSTTVSEQSNAAVTAKVFADMVSEASNGNIKITVYPSDQLAGGNMSKGVEMLRQGAIDAAFEPVDVLAVLDQSLLAMSIPWTFSSYQEAEDILKGTGGEYIKGALQPQGLETLGFIHNGFRQLTNNKREVTTLEDLKGMKLRVPGGDVFVEFFKALNADPIAMSFSELFTALQQGTVDGQENGFDLIVANKFYEVQKFITEWNYSYGAFALVFNKDFYDKLDDNTKKLLQEKAIEACKIGNQNVVDNEASKKKITIDSGTKVTTLTPDQIDAFKAELDSYYELVKGKYGDDAVAAFGIE